ncbi:MAG: hypothetical protein ABIF01_01795 [Candidatus Micrarchaeota archaeon]
MAKENSILGLVIGLVVLFVILGSVLYLGVFNLAGKSVYSQSLGASSSESGYSGDRAYAPNYYDRGPSYHVFNYFNSGALSVMLIIGVIVALMMVDALYKKTESFLASILYIIGTLLLFASATILLFGIHDILTFTGPGETFKKPTVMQQYGWLIESVVFGVMGIAFVVAGEHIRRSEDEEGSLKYLAVTPIASLLALFAIPTFILGIHNVIFPSYSDTSFTWVIEAIIFGGLGVIAFNWIDKKRQEKGETSVWRIYPLYALGYALLVPAVFLFIAGTHAYLTDKFARDVWKAFVEALVFAPLGILAFYAIDKLREKEKDFRSCLPNALAPIGAVFALATVFMLLTGFSGFLRANITADTYRGSFTWVVEVILFGLIGYAALAYNDRITKGWGKVPGALPKVLSACGLLLWIASLLFFFVTVQTFAFDKNPDGRLLAEFIVYGFIGLGFIVYSDRLRKAEGILKDDVLPNALLLAGSILLLATILAFVFDLHAFLYSENPDVKWIVRVFAYGIIGGLYLLASNSMKPINIGKKKGEKEAKSEEKLKAKQLKLKGEKQNLKELVHEGE